MKSTRLVLKRRLHQKHTHIDQAKRRLDKGESLGEASIVSRETVISELRRGTTYVTAFKGPNDKWDRGQTVFITKQTVFITKVNEVKYIKTVEDNTTKDNLDELLEL